MYYAINDEAIKNPESLNDKITEVLKHVKKVYVIPLAETREDLFEEIYNETFDVESLVSAVRLMAALHQEEGIVIGYNYVDYVNIVSLIKEKCDKIVLLASATDPELEEETLAKIKPIKKEGVITKKQVKAA
jgi:hypothetical protein